MTTIKKKIRREYFDAILAGKKKFELRLNDFDIAEGDTLLLEEWDPIAKSYTGRKLEKKVKYVGKFKMEELAKFWSEQDFREKGIQIILFG